MTKIKKRQLTPIAGEPNRFHVESDSPTAEPYLVDLESYGGNGECSCIDFQVHQNKVAEITQSGSHFFRCKHLETAFHWKALVAVRADSHE